MTGDALISASADSGRWKTARAELGAGLRSWYCIVEFSVCPVNSSSIDARIVVLAHFEMFEGRYFAEALANTQDLARLQQVRGRRHQDEADSSGGAFAAYSGCGGH